MAETRRRERVQASSAVTSRRLSMLLNADRAVEQRIGELDNKGRVLAKASGLFSEPVKANSREIQALVDKRNRIGALIVALRRRGESDH